MKIYISGGITGVDDYIKYFNRAEKTLVNFGFTVVNPARVMSSLPVDTPYECYMDLSYDMLKYCDAIYMLRGWEYSNGACNERAYASRNGKKIIYEADGVLKNPNEY